MGTSSADDVVRLAVESVVLEQWLRFYWLEEVGDALVIRPPDEAKEHIAAVAPHLLPLARSLDGAAADARASYLAITSFVASAGAACGSGCSGCSGGSEGQIAVFDLPEFQDAVGRFQLWVAEQAEALDAVEPDFSSWLGWEPVPRAS